MIVQVYMDSAPPWIGRQHPDALFVSSNGQAIRPESSPGYCRDHPAVAAADSAFYEALARRAGASPAFAGFDLWSEPHVDQLGKPDLHRQPRVLLLPQHRRALPRLAAREVQNPRRAECGLVPPLRRVGRGRAEPAEHDPLLQRLRRLEALHRRQARRGPARPLRGGQARRAPARPRPATPPAWACSPRRTTGKGSRTTGRWPSRSTTTARPSTPSTPHSWTARSSGAAPCSTSRARSASPAGRGGFWIGELQAGFGTIALNVSPTVTPEDLRVWTWSALARGAKASAPTRTTR